MLENKLIAKPENAILATDYLKVMNILTMTPATTKQIALKLNLPRARIQYIIDGLLSNEVVKVDSTDSEGDISQIFYRSVNSNVEYILNNTSEDDSFDTLRDLLQTTGRDLLQAIRGTKSNKVRLNGSEANNQSPPLCLRITRNFLKQPNARDLVKKLEQLSQTFESLDDTDMEQEYIFLFSIFPAPDAENG